MMRKLFRYRQQPSHKHAVKALYRSFLRCTGRLEVVEVVKAEVRERVKRRFRMHRNECSYERLNKMLVAGYENQNIFLMASTHDHPQQYDSTLRILNTLRSLVDHHIFLLERQIRTLDLLSTRPDPVLIPPKPKRPRGPPPSPEGPLPSVPIVIDANSFPLLRWPGQPQSEHISSIIRHKIRLKDERARYFEDKPEWEAMARKEDEWEDLVSLELELLEQEASDEEGVCGTMDAGKEGYIQTLEETTREVERSQQETFRKSNELTKKFLEIKWEREELREEERVRRRKMREEEGRVGKSEFKPRRDLLMEYAEERMQGQQQRQGERREGFGGQGSRASGYGQGRDGQQLHGERREVFGGQGSRASGYGQGRDGGMRTNNYDRGQNERGRPNISFQGRDDRSRPNNYSQGQNEWRPYSPPRTETGGRTTTDTLKWRTHTPKPTSGPGGAKTKSLMDQIRERMLQEQKGRE